MKLLRVGNPLDQETELSTHLHPTSETKIKEHLSDALSYGAKQHLNAKEVYEPEVLTSVTKQMRCFKEETFGPLVTLMPFSSVQEAIDLANATDYGLASYVFTQNIQTATRVCKELEFGMVGLNDGLPSCAELPFGGVKDSGFGREGGPSGIHEFLYTKAISQKL